MSETSHHHECTEQRKQVKLALEVCRSRALTFGASKQVCTEVQEQCMVKVTKRHSLRCQTQTYKCNQEEERVALTAKLCHHIQEEMEKRMEKMPAKRPASQQKLKSKKEKQKLLPPIPPPDKAKQRVNPIYRSVPDLTRDAVDLKQQTPSKPAEMKIEKVKKHRPWGSNPRPQD